jgi:ADP-ribose pyrophosphatase
MPGDEVTSSRVWKTLSRKVLLSKPPWLTVEAHEIQLPDGKLISGWPWVITPEYVSIAPLTAEGRFLCFRQTKYALQGTSSLAAVGGYLEAGESPIDGAKRELREETGYEATTWVDLGSYVVEANRGVGRGHFFLAHDARQVTEEDKDDLEDQESLLLTPEEIEQALVQREFKVMSWAATFALALLHLRQGNEAKT